MPDDGEIDGPPPQWTPPKATKKAAHFWEMGPLARGLKLLTADPNTDGEFVESLVLIGFESFSPAEMHEAIRQGRDIVPDVIKKGALHYKVVSPWARMLIRKYWNVIYYYLVGFRNDPWSGPPGIIQRMRFKDPLVAREFESQEGWAWLVWTCYQLIGFLKIYADPRDTSLIPRPTMRSPIRAPELAGHTRR